MPVRWLLAAAADDYHVAVLFLAYTGVRFGELAALRVGRVDLMRRRATLSESITKVHGRARVQHPEDASEPPGVDPADHGRLPRRPGGRQASDDFVFGAQNGHVLRISNFRRKGFEPAVATAGLGPLTHTRCTTQPPASPSRPVPT
jgi:integrase